MNEYILEVCARCPIEPALTDVYQARIESNKTVQVEKILSAFDKYRNAEIFQEDLTRKVSGELGVRVELTGIHSGVKVISTFP